MTDTVSPPGVEGDVAIRRSACPMDCPDACSLDVETRDGRVVALRGSEVNPVTQGWMCAKMTRYPERMYGADRLTRPMRRVGPKGEGKFEPISWDEALALAARRIDAVRRERGGDAILPYHYDGSNGVFAHDAIDGALWRSIGACEIERTLCAAPASGAAKAVYGKMAGVAFPDYVHARAIVIWGGNPSVSNTHLVPYLDEARRRGARLAVVDPRRTPFASKADVHVPIWPGADLPVALALLAETERRGKTASEFLARHATNADALLAEARPWSLERAARAAKVDVDVLTSLADLYLEASPALLRVGWGLERNRNGDAAMVALLALPAIAGKFGVRGGGYTLSNSGAYATEADALIGVPEPDRKRRVVNMSKLGEALSPESTPRVDLLFVYDANPCVSTPDAEAVRAGLLREDLFTVVFEQVATDTVRYADLVLPATTFLEQHELHRGYGAMTLQRIDPVAAPVGESRPNEVVFAELAARLGFRGEAFDPDPAKLRARYVKASRGLPPDAAETIETTGVVHLRFGGGAPGPIQFVDAFPLTEDRKADLFPQKWRALGADAFRFVENPGTAEAPLALLSPATSRTINSTLGDLDDRPLTASLAPGDAAARGLRDGDVARIFNRLSSLTALVRVDPTLREGVCVLPKGAWLRTTRDGRGPNSLISQETTPVTGGATYNDARVEVAKV